MPTPPKNTSDFKALVEVVEALRGPQGCPWDKEQTHKTLAQYAIEETYELVDAIESDCTEDIVEELGDMLLQVILHSEIGRQAQRFTLQDVLQKINTKMIARHPHVFSDVKVSGVSEVWNNWNQIKAAEKKTPSNKNPKNPFASIPKQLPALQASQKIGNKTRSYNFDWSKTSDVLDKIDEELLELKNAMVDATKDTTEDATKEIEHEIGDLLFSIAQLSRHLNLDAEQCLRSCNQRFQKRFMAMQKIAENQGKQLTDLSTDQLEKLWQEVKANLL